MQTDSINHVIDVDVGKSGVQNYFFQVNCHGLLSFNP
jgi:hypothetical protein